MKIRKKPYDIDFLGNNPEYILHATPYSAEGRCYSRVFTINALPSGDLLFVTEGKTLTWHLSSDPSDGLWELPSVADTDAQHLYDALDGKFMHNPDINRDFTLALRITGGALTLKVTAKEPGSHAVNLHHTGSPYFITQATPVTGIDRVIREDYRAMAFFEITSSKGTSCTPAMYHEECDGDVHISTDIIREWFPKPDIPNPSEFFTAVPCRNATVKARLFFGEMYADGNDSSMLKTMAHSNAITLSIGKMEDYAADNNLPDWRSADDDHFHLKTGIDIFGQDNGGTVICPCGSEQYIYIYNYGSSNVTARVIETVIFSDGTSDDDWNDENVTLQPGLNRITVREDDTTAAAWTVTVEVTGGNTVTRNYIVRDYDHGYHTFLMLNAMNLYETFIVEDLSREEQSEGERRIIAGTDGYGNTDRNTVYTAKCHPRNADGLKLLRTAFHKQDNLLSEGRYAWYIDMVPGSLTVLDESEDVISCEFKFRLREKVNRNPDIISITSEEFAAEQVVTIDTVFK